MHIKPILDSWEIPHIESIRIAERRVWAEHPIPGRVGSVYQDLGARPAALVIAGTLADDDMRDDFLQQVRTKFQAGQPVTFSADITTATQIQYVLIEDLTFEEVAWSPDTFRYQITLRESPPPPPPGGVPDLDSSLLDQAQNLVGDIADLADVLDTLDGVPDIGNPVPPLMGVLDGVKSATSALGPIADGLKGLFGV